MSAKVNDADILDGVKEVNELFAHIETLIARNKVLEAQNQKLVTEKQIQNDQTASSTTMREISKRLEKTIESLEKPRKIYKARLYVLKNQIKKLEETIENLKTEHLGQLCALEVEKDRLLEEFKKNYSPSSVVEETQTERMDDTTALKITITNLQKRLDVQFDEFDEKQQLLDLEVQKLKDENEDLRKKIRQYEVEELTHCPSSASLVHSFSRSVKKPKKNAKRKLFNPLDLS